MTKRSDGDVNEGRRLALAKLGLAASAFYVAPVVLGLGAASADGDGSFGVGGHSGGGTGAQGKGQGGGTGSQGKGKGEGMGAPSAGKGKDGHGPDSHSPEPSNKGRGW